MTTILSFLLSIALSLTFQLHVSATDTFAQVPPGAPSSDEGLVVKACERALHKDYCITLLKSDSSYTTNTDLKGLAFIALTNAERNATETSLFIKTALENPSLQPAEQEGLSDCSDHYITAVDLIDDAINALVSDDHGNVTAFGKAAVTDLDACNASIKDRNVTVAQKNLGVRIIVNTALSVAHVYAH